MSYFLPRLESGWHADQAILAEDDRVVVIRFGHDWVRPFSARIYQSNSRFQFRIKLTDLVLWSD